MFPPATFTLYIWLRAVLPYTVPVVYTHHAAVLEHPQTRPGLVCAIFHIPVPTLQHPRHGGVANESGLTNDATGENGVQEAKGDCATPAGTKTREQLEDDIAYEAEKNNIREGRAIYDSSLVSVECLGFLKQVRPDQNEKIRQPQRVYKYAIEDIYCIRSIDRLKKASLRRPK